MKSDKIFAILLVSIVALTQAQTNSDYKSFKIQINNNWYEAEGKINKSVLKEIKSIKLQSKSTPSKEAKVASGGWSIRYAGYGHSNSFVETGSFDFTNKSITSISISEAALKKIQSGGIFMIDNIKVEGADKSFPGYFRLFFE